MPRLSVAATPAVKVSAGATWTPIVIIDLVPGSDDRPVATRVFSFTFNDGDPVVARLLEMVKSLGSLDSIAPTYRVFRFIREHGEELSTHSSNRWVSHRGDSIEVVVFRADGQTPDVTIQEQARQSRLTADIDSLVENAGSIGNRMDRAKSHGNVSITRRKYRLRDRSAILRITASIELAESAAGEKAVADPAVTTTLVTGPSERVFLSANAAFTKVRQVRYNTDAGTFEPGHKPTEFLIGVNYTMQDMFQNDNSSGTKAFIRGIYLGFLVESSRRPFNQIAATLGFRHSPPPFESLFSLETVSPYVGVVWARDDVPNPSAPSSVDTRYGKPSMIWGLALGLDKALGWLGGAR